MLYLSTVLAGLEDGEEVTFKIVHGTVSYEAKKVKPIEGNLPVTRQDPLGIPGMDVMAFLVQKSLNDLRSRAEAFNT